MYVLTCCHNSICLAILYSKQKHLGCKKVAWPIARTAVTKRSDIRVRPMLHNSNVLEVKR